MGSLVILLVEPIDFIKNLLGRKDRDITLKTISSTSLTFSNKPERITSFITDITTFVSNVPAALFLLFRFAASFIGE